MITYVMAFKIILIENSNVYKRMYVIYCLLCKKETETRIDFSVCIVYLLVLCVGDAKASKA